MDKNSSSLHAKTPDASSGGVELVCGIGQGEGGGGVKGIKEAISQLYSLDNHESSHKDVARFLLQKPLATKEVSTPINPGMHCTQSTYDYERGGGGWKPFTIALTLNAG